MPYYSDMIKAQSWFVYVLAECDEDDTVAGGYSHTGYYKIGTASNVKFRMSGLISGNPRVLQAICERDMGSRNAARAVEKLAHRTCQRRVRMTEWFRSDAKTIIRSVDAAISEIQPKIYHNGEYVERIAV